MSEIYKKVTTIIAQELGIDAESLTLETRFKEDLQADSIAVVELIMAFEDAFSQSISDEDSEKIETIQDVVTYIEQHTV